MTRTAVHFGSAPDGGTIGAGRHGVGDVIGGYRIERIRSEAPAAVVYEASHLGLGCGMPAAIKVFRTTDPRALESLRAAVRRISRFGGPHVVRIFDVGALPTKESPVGDRGAQPYVVMDLLEGQNLGERIEQGGAFSISSAAEVALQLCHGLEEPHRHRIIHGNLKPSSIIVRQPGDAALHASMLGFDRPGRCSAGYASPEQLGARADVDPRTDVRALGIILFEMLTGLRAFPVRTIEEMRLSAVSRSLPPMTSPHGRIPETLQNIVRRCASIHRTSRFATAHELAAALAPFVITRTSAPPPKVAAPRAKLESTLPSKHAETLDNEDFKSTVLKPALSPVGDRAAQSPVPAREDQVSTATRSAFDLTPPTAKRSHGASRSPTGDSDSTRTIALAPPSSGSGPDCASRSPTGDSTRTLARPAMVPPAPTTVVPPHVMAAAAKAGADSTRTIQRAIPASESPVGDRDAQPPQTVAPRTISEPVTPAVSPVGDRAAQKPGATPTQFHGSAVESPVGDREAQSSRVPTVRPAMQRESRPAMPPTPTGPFQIASPSILTRASAMQRPPMLSPSVSPVGDREAQSAAPLPRLDDHHNSSEDRTRISTLAMARPILTPMPVRAIPTPMPALTHPMTPPLRSMAQTRASSAPRVASGSFPMATFPPPVRSSDAPVAFAAQLMTAEVLPKRRWAVRGLMAFMVIGALASVKLVRRGELVGMATAASTPMTSGTAPVASSARLAPLPVPEAGLLPPPGGAPRGNALASAQKPVRVVPAVRSGR